MYEGNEITADALQAAIATALRKWTTELTNRVGLSQAEAMLFGEAVSCAQAHRTPDEIAVLLRQMADKIDGGALDMTIQ